MLSFFSKTQQATPTTAAYSDSPLPKIIDINSIDPITANNNASAAPAKKSGFSFWPFYSSNRQEQSQHDNANSNDIASATPGDDLKSIKDSTNEVIAMKKYQMEEGETDEFIDIQVRKLSYAEVAALQVGPSAVNSKSPGKSKVIDQDKELEKSVTDLEFVANYQKTKKFENAVDQVDVEKVLAQEKQDYHFDDALDDEEDFYPTKKLPKKYSKNSKYGKKTKK